MTNVHSLGRREFFDQQSVYQFVKLAVFSVIGYCTRCKNFGNSSVLLLARRILYFLSAFRGSNWPGFLQRACIMDAFTSPNYFRICLDVI
jgi:hypothetical protein